MRQRTWWMYVVLICLAIFALGPLLIFVFDALKTEPELSSNPLGLPAHPQWHNFIDAWTQAGMAVGLRNSIIIVLGTMIGVVVIGGLAAYAMSRLQLPGQGAVMTYLLVVTSLPIQLFLVPLFFLWTKIGLYDTQFGIIVIYWAVYSPFATLLMRSFMIGIPASYEEAARLDGAGEIGIITRVVLPMAWPGVLTAALVSALSAYNEFLLVLTFVQTNTKQPLSLTFFAFQQGYSQNYVLICASGVIMILPMLILFLLLQRRFVEGVASQGLAAE